MKQSYSLCPGKQAEYYPGWAVQWGNKILWGFALVIKPLYP